MGAYLPKPVKEKICESGENAHIRYGACTMQGWRTHQEDSHNCILDYDDDKASLFAVYDGHGGHEVAEYAARKFPQLLKQMETWSTGCYGQALEDAFLAFDESLIKPEIIEELKTLVGVPEEDDEEDEVEDKNRLLEEANLPIEDVLSRYGIQLQMANSDEEDHDGSPQQKTVRIKRTSKRKISVKCSKKLVDGVVKLANKAMVENGDSNLPANGDMSPHEKKLIGEGDLKNCADTVQVDGTTATGKNGAAKLTDSSLEDKLDANNDVDKIHEPPAKKGKTLANGDHVTKENDEIQKCTEPLETAHNGQPAIELCDVDKVAQGEMPKKTETGHVEDEEDDDEYADESDEKEESSESVDEESEEEEADSEEETIEEEDEETTEIDEFPVPTEDKPGVSSGTTACTLLLRGTRVWVANAGDSRCVLSRAGRALDLSADHKPEDEVERLRILAAGGRITDEGRVNGGLNLSRALGDHFYKTNTSLPLKDQMISCLPDITVESLSSSDEFIVVACDGIWNSMSSQAVVDFVSARLRKGISLPKICEEICDSCLAEDTLGDGTGCDNMTVIIVDLKGGARSEAGLIAAGNNTTTTGEDGAN